MLVHKAGTLIVLKKFFSKSKQSLIGVVLGYEATASVQEVCKKGFLVFDENKYNTTPDVLKVRPYDQDKWQEFLNSQKTVNSEFCFIDVTDNKGINKFFHPYIYQFEDLVVRKDDPHGTAYQIKQFNWQGDYSISSDKRRMVLPKNKGFKVTLKPIIGGRGLTVKISELEKDFDLYE